MPHGGKRAGAGRPARAKVKLQLGACGDPRDFLAAVMRNDACDVALRVRAAGMLLANELQVEKFKVGLYPNEESWPPNPAGEGAKAS